MADTASKQEKKEKKEKSESKSYGKVWLFFIYYWLIFGVGCYFGQFLPMEWRKPLSLVLLVLVLANLFIKHGRKYGIVMSHIYTLAIGLLSFATFTIYLQNLGAEVFYKNVILAISAFIVFGLIGYFLINDASGMGRYLFVILVSLIIAGIVGIFINNPVYHTITTIVGLLLFLMYTIFDFNRMKRGNFNARELGFNLFINLLNIVRDVLRLADRVRK
ncbi:uncharacterized protein ACUW9N_001061 [Staphylococcus auricularis]|uniref:Bax inhibitor-1 family protein n=1 Tax=Staphylococcus auricularis TaxID=29379 RepID=A0AAW7MFU9_9STAP|nr:Bax inhibitor-1 family protein [Staphylococcus auricularis]MBM0868620.1 hypothetical protein [Staphylococcus auricularis]MCE5038733.1 Bax inhibitor-1/YccA family protein [Staphylococcus auricularis]MCG7341394.1 Bax inhibitor-1 family protein [Staphylococcus auricularis]MDC6327487.1 Bax inhibitor-1 family protein [Staphylococcus auricularis]MDN4534104.1 Bax inhibitor-1 family protein [Staphylococcus auricularis]